MVVQTIKEAGFVVQMKQISEKVGKQIVSKFIETNRYRRDHANGYTLVDVFDNQQVTNYIKIRVIRNDILVGKDTIITDGMTDAAIIAHINGMEIKAAAWTILILVDTRPWTFYAVRVYSLPVT